MNDLLYTTLHAEIRDPRPISVNKLYSTKRDGTRYLSTEGKHFKDKLGEAISKAAMTHPAGWGNVVNAVYKSGGHIALSIELHIEGLFNGSWKPGGSKTEKGGPRSPYQKVDATNYIKLIEDAVVRGTGIDDSCHLDITIRKREDKTDPRVVILYEVYE